ncbi:MAG: TetR family transcriptional regulator [Thermodesulfobacteriota bacterium]|nr:TetR family transcriptional regulator [Thermodesulfobacteriota bacterium]
MARKSREDAEKTRLSLIDAALVLFYEKGFARTSLKEIADQAGVTRGAVYWHFKNKNDLFIKLADEIEFSTGIDPEQWLDHKTITTLEDLKNSLVGYLDHLENNDRLKKYYEILIYKTEFTRDLEPVISHERGKLRRILKLLKATFKKMKSTSAVKEDLDPEDAAFLVYSSVWGIIETWLFDQKRLFISKKAYNLMSMLLKGMEPD